MLSLLLYHTENCCYKLEYRHYYYKHLSSSFPVVFLHLALTGFIFSLITPLLYKQCFSLDFKFFCYLFFLSPLCYINIAFLRILSFFVIFFLITSLLYKHCFSLDFKFFCYLFSLSPLCYINIAFLRVLSFFVIFFPYHLSVI